MATMLPTTKGETSGDWYIRPARKLVLEAGSGERLWRSVKSPGVGTLLTPPPANSSSEDHRQRLQPAEVEVVAVGEVCVPQPQPRQPAQHRLEDDLPFQMRQGCTKAV